MPFALLIVGAVLVVAAIKNTQGNLALLVKGDFTGQNNFVYWVVAILLIGAVGYVPKLKPISTAFLGLVILVLFLSKGNPGAASGGFFSQFTSALSTTNTVIGPNSTALPNGIVNTTPVAPTVGNFSLPSIPSLSNLVH